MNGISSDIIVGVISGLLASLVFFIITPILKKLGDWIIRLVIDRNKKFRDFSYMHTASRVPPYSSDQNVMIILTLICSFLSVNYLERPEIIKEHVFIRIPYELFFIWVFIGSLVMYFTFRLGIRRNVIDRIRRFDNTICLIRPYTSVRDIHLVERDWVLMRTYEDFLKIKDQLKQLKDEAEKKASIETVGSVI